MKKTETRTFRSGSLRASQGDEMVIAGRALSYGVRSGNLGGFFEQFLPGAFSQHLATKPSVLCRREHETGFLLGRTDNGSLVLQDGPAGLDFRCKIDPNDPIAVSTHAAIKSGLIDSMSFAFAADDDSFDPVTDENGRSVTLRTVKRAILLDVAPVAKAAYPVGTSVSARAADYSVVAARPQDQTAIKAQIAAFDKRQADKRRQRNADVRSIAATVPGAPLEEILRWRKSGYSIDVQNELRLAAITQQLRAGYTGADFDQAGPRSEDGGAVSDPQQLLRDDDEPFDWDTEWFDRSLHERAAAWHRCLAQKSSTWQRGAAHHAAADKHDAAARAYPDLEKGAAARAASKAILTLADVS